nr:myosin-6-like [Onthophagus taurus]
MSTFECGDNIVLGDGDGARRTAFQKTSSKRNPVPSCRRFATRQNHVQQDNLARVKLEEALSTLQKSAPSTPLKAKSSSSEPFRHRKRSKTMSEITPTKRKPIDPNLSGDGPSRPPPPKREEAARRVYQRLLLNSWRQRKIQVNTLTESSAKLQTQVDQLQIQVDVLQKLRESEAGRRSISACENAELRKECEDLRSTAETIEKDNVKLRADILNLERTLSDVEAKNQSLKIELGNARCEFAICERKAAKEIILNNCLRDENTELNEKLNAHIKAADEFRQAIKKLKEQLTVVEKNLAEANANIITLQENKRDLISKLQNESEEKTILSKDLNEEKEKRTEIEKKLQQLKNVVENLSKLRSKLTDDNVNLRATLMNLERDLAHERAQKWWKQAATTIVDSLQNAATIMLPAFPKGNRNKTTSTTDLPPRGVIPAKKRRD